MFPLPQPLNEQGQPFSPMEVFLLCISKIRNPILKSRLEQVATQIETASIDFGVRAGNQTLHQIARMQLAGNVTKDEFIGVYEPRMSTKTYPGKPIYDRIFSIPKQELCPLCGVNRIKTLDHHLPKSFYPILSVTPNNLVPACHDCQDAKDNTYPTQAGEQTLHPYYDDFTAHEWLQARVLEATPPGFEYFVEPPTEWQGEISDRLNRHMIVLDLKKLFSVRAASEMNDLRKGLGMLYPNGGAAAVRQQLEWQATSCNDKNSWKSAMYRAASRSDWFCDGGFAVT